MERTTGRRGGFGLVLGAVLALAQVAPAQAESNGGVRVMPLGDSITDGYNVPGGYRINLWQRLAGGGYTVDFVGSQYNGPAIWATTTTRATPGWRIDETRRQHRRLDAGEPARVRCCCTSAPTT